MPNVDEPHGLRPLGFTASGGPLIVKEFKKQKGSSIYRYDALHQVPDGTVEASSAVPGHTFYCGVTLQHGPFSEESSLLVVVSPTGVFEAQTDGDCSGIVATDGELNANLVLGVGNPKTLMSAHEVDASTLGSDTNLDVKLLGLLDAPDNGEGEYARVEIIFNRHSMKGR
jgi:hypothetical protein